MKRIRKVHIPIAAFVEDIRAGLDDDRLMKKYNVRQETLLKAFDKLVETGRVTEEELMNRSPFINTQAIVDFLGNSKAIDELE